MPRISWSWVLMGLAVVGCSRQDTPRTANRDDDGSRRYSRRDDDRTGRYEEESTGDVYLEYEARQARRRIEQAADEAEEAIRRARRDLRLKADQAADLLEDAAVEFAEEVKDRALDAPDEVDQFFDREFNSRLRDWQLDEREEDNEV